MRTTLFDYCQKFLAVVALWLFCSASDSVLLNYIFFLIVILLLKPQLKEDINKKINIKDSTISVFLFLMFSFLLSFLFQEGNRNTPNILSVTLLAPLFEEIFFRKLLTRNMSTLSGAIFSSLIFALFHPLKLFVPTFLLGTVLFYIYKKCGLKISITAHMLNNILALF